MLLVLVLSTFLLFSPPASFALPPQEIFTLVKDKVVVLDVVDNKGNKTSDHTALLLDGGKAVTLCDLVAEASSLTLRDGKGAYLAKPSQKDISRNLCQLEVVAPPGGVILRDSDPVVGSRVYAVSNVLGLGISISEGVVSGVRDIGGETAIQFTAPIAPGSGGGGLFDEEGRLVGVIIYELRDGQNVNFAQPARWIREIGTRSAFGNGEKSWLTKANALVKEGNWRELRDVAAKELPESRKARYFLAYAQKQLEEWQAAEENYRELFKWDPMSLLYGFGLAEVLYEQKKFPESLEIIRATQNFHHENARLFVLTAYIQEKMGNDAEVKAALEKAVQLEPWNQEALKATVALSRRHKEWTRAISAQTRLVGVDPGDVTERLVYVDLLIRIGRAEKALANVEIALEAAPANGDAWVLKGDALARLGRTRDAVAALKNGLQLNPQNILFVWMQLGNIYYGLRLYPEAIAAYREAIRLAPNSNEVRGELGLALKDGRHNEEALGLFENMREKAPNDPFSWRQVGYVRAMLDQPDKAIDALEQSLKLDSDQPKVWAALIETYHSAGRLEDAKRTYVRLKSIDPKWAEYAWKRVLLPYGVAP